MTRMFRGTVILLLAGLVMGCEQEVKRTETEVGPNTLAAEQAMQRRTACDRRKDAKGTAGDTKETGG